MVISSNLGFPRMGANRELKKLVESYWAGKIDQKSLIGGAQNLRLEHWKLQKDAGIEHVPSNDFSFYDQVLDHVVLFGAIPAKYSTIADELTQYFAMARGLQTKDADITIDVPAMEMKKWFDSNYHFEVPEFEANQSFRLNANPKPLREFQEALQMAGIKTRPVLLGPLSFLFLGKSVRRGAEGNFDAMDTLSLLPRLMPAYIELVQKLASAGAEWIQFDEPILSLDLDLTKMKPLFLDAYAQLKRAADKRTRLLVANYFGTVGDNVGIFTELPVDALHIDLIRAPQDLELVIDNLPTKMMLSVGVVNGRNIWKTDLNSSLKTVNFAVSSLGSDRVIVAPSCSLLHSPFSIKSETKMDADILNWMSFAAEKLDEIALLVKAVENPEAVANDLQSNSEAIQSRKQSKLIHDDKVKGAIESITPGMFKRKSHFKDRYPAQITRLGLPMYPTTTIGSFPQTKEVRVARQKYRSGEMKPVEYEKFINEQIRDCVRLQESIGLDVLVHGEAERNDMVEYFGSNMRGYVFSQNGWVQSYGSRCVKPPIVYGDVSRPKPMTVETISYAQSLTSKSMKGMLTGPVTMLQWSFVRDDQPRSETTFQLALAIRQEVVDLEAAGIKVIQIDEPAIREGLPLRRKDWDAYLKWAVDAFRLCSSGVRDETQIHSHFCYSDFNDIFKSINDLDADVITIENARSDLKLLEAFHSQGYQNAIGPGVYDIHSPRVPGAAEIQDRVRQLQKYIKPNLLWINPDCGLKTRNQAEVVKSLTNMVSVAKALRSEAH
eukprot:Partr_v1_DN28320_c1_g1_i1_m78896 putative 5-methyltetrahydropteroyltriglutamate--homocysteine